MASVRFMDEQVGRLLDGLDRLGIRDETIVVFISDHGYNFADTIRYRENRVKVPEVVADFPGMKEGVAGMKFIEAVVKSSNKNAAWTKI
jgi:arylsulfatase A-like enzyme